MRKLLFFMAFLAATAILPTQSGASAFWQYQENATAYSCDGTWVDCAKTYDADWATYGTGNTDGTVYMNYTKPSAAGYTPLNSTTWMTKAQYANTNNTLNNTCFDLNPLQFRVWSWATGGRYGSQWSCWNSTDWMLLLDQNGTAVDAHRIYEEGIWWHVNRSGPWLELNLTNLNGTTVLSLVTVNKTVQYTTNYLAFYLGNQSLSRISVLLENQTISFDNSNSSFMYNVTLLNGTVKWQKFRVMTRDSIGLDGAFVRVYDGIYRRLVFSGYTENGGYVLVPMNLQAAYWFEVTLEGYNTYTGTKYIYTLDDTTENIELTAPETMYNWWDYAPKISGLCVDNKTAQTINCTANDASSEHYVSEFCLNVARLETYGYVTSCYSCNSTTDNTALGCQITGAYGNKTFVYQLTAVLGDGSEYLVYSGAMSLLQGAAIYGLSGVFAALMIILTLSFIGLWSPVTSIIGGTIGLMVSLWLGLFVVSPAVVIGIVIVAGIIMVRSR